MERRKSQSSMPEIAFVDIEYAGEVYTHNNNKKKESKFYRYTALIGIFILLSIVFLTTSVAAPFRHFGFSKQSSEQMLNLEANSKVAGENVVNIVEAIEERLSPLTPKKPSKLQIISDLNMKCQGLIEEVRKIKGTGVIMDIDPAAQKYIKVLQTDLRSLLTMRFGEKPRILIEMVVGFPTTMIDIDTTEPSGKIVFELADFELVPYSVYNWLEITRRFHGGAFHRNAGHVLQAQVGLLPAEKNDNFAGIGMAFQEYNELVPHKKLSLGYAGRPGGPAFYISTVDNTKNHGPGSQGSSTEADSCFAQLVTGEDVVNRMKHQPGGNPPSGFVASPDNFIKILSMRILSPTDAGAELYAANDRNEGF